MIWQPAKEEYLFPGALKCNTFQSWNIRSCTFPKWDKKQLPRPEVRSGKAWVPILCVLQSQSRPGAMCPRIKCQRSLRALNTELPLHVWRDRLQGRPRPCLLGSREGDCECHPFLRFLDQGSSKNILECKMYKVCLKGEHEAAVLHLNRWSSCPVTQSYFVAFRELQNYSQLLADTTEKGHFSSGCLHQGDLFTEWVPCSPHPEYFSGPENCHQLSDLVKDTSIGLS